ncbi:hypothetical protein EXIGLDRAFT_761942 [Exidia glandulosa HHB12029]|uniref:Uncharacterized protein n=1 Tax=Exidia glandulosa HHB12029 TaxID=1314781 RepID=A0A165N1J2_EXIGL|nr:hypothetical protein EXIGLDRAFT_761942 [Exidia glandulosa HHB12029]
MASPSFVMPSDRSPPLEDEECDARVASMLHSNRKYQFQLGYTQGYNRGTLDGKSACATELHDLRQSITHLRRECEQKDITIRELQAHALTVLPNDSEVKARDEGAIASPNILSPGFTSPAATAEGMLCQAGLEAEIVALFQSLADRGVKPHVVDVSIPEPKSREEFLAGLSHIGAQLLLNSCVRY